MAERYVTECPAKINLFLRVRQADGRGYHPLETEFQAIGLFDTLEVTVGEGGFAVEGMELPESNTVTRALRLMREVATLPALGVRLTKRIPAQAGLGGGSSDAAGLLRILRKVLPPSVPERDFIAVAKSVGADVPFFGVGGRARGAGYGDVVTALPDEDRRWMVVGKPAVACSTPAMFAALDAFRATGGQEGLDARFIENDFHAVAPQACVRLMDSFLEAGLGPVGLCGSGSAVFGFAASETAARRCGGLVGSVWVVRTLGRDESVEVGIS
ncbi:MAG: 4-(cytidine 5'-diphospho)-2-C-methyl-D-erythritol kinase [Fimbriimonadaceae bacterium]